MVLNNKKQLFLIYGLFLVWTILIILNRSWQPSWQVFLVLAYFLLWPGYFTAKWLKIDDERGVMKPIWYSLLSAVILFVLSTIAYILNFNINHLIILFWAVLAVLSALGLFTRIKSSESVEINFKTYLKTENLVYLIPVAVIGAILLAVENRGAHFAGDPVFHLTILRKVTSGSPLNLSNLSYVKSQASILYVLPLWHIIVGSFSVISNINIFIFWNEAVTAIALWSFGAWYWLFRKVFPIKYFAVLAVILYGIFTFEQDGYLFARIMVPDTFNKLVILPLVFGLTLKFIFEKSANVWKIFAILVLLSLSLAFVHMTQFFYFLFGYFLFILIYLSTQFKQPDYKETVKKLFASLILPAAILFSFILTYQLKNRYVSHAFEVFSMPNDTPMPVDSFGKFALMAKIAYLFVPVILIFKRSRKMLLLVAVSLLAPLVYSSNLIFFREILIKKLSFVFVKRLYFNVTWHYAVWAVILGLMVIGLDYLISKISKNHKILRLINGIMGIIVLASFYLQFKLNWFKLAYSGLLTRDLNTWINYNYSLILPLILLIVFGIILLRKLGNKRDILIGEPKNPFLVFSLTLMFTFFFFAPGWKSLIGSTSSELAKPHFLSETRDPTDELTVWRKFGGKEMADYINNQLPHKQVFETNSGYFFLPLAVDQHMSNYWSQADKQYGIIYQNNVPLDKKLTCLARSKADYLIYVNPSKNQIYFDQNKEIFTKVYEVETANLYKINQAVIGKLGADGPVKPLDNICKAP